MKMYGYRKLGLISALVSLLAGACDDDTSGPSLNAPTVSVAQQTPSRVVLTISAVSGATSYQIERAPATGDFAEVGTSTTTTFEDATVQSSTTYRYRVAAVSGALTSAFSAVVTVNTPAPGSVTITGDITADRTLHADTVYTLAGFVHVGNGATLTIQPGTRIVGSTTVLGSSLFILRGATIIANGTAQAPIVFTSGRAVNDRAPGDWGGLVLVGNARINRTGTVTIEGTGGCTANCQPGENYAVTYSGGSVAGDAGSSGSLQYVRVEFAGFQISDANELNSFTFAALGSGTTLHHLQSVSGLDDSFEWFGGTPDAKYLVSYESGDDHFDMSEGFSGRLQFLIGYQSRVLIPRSGAGMVATDPQGIENDGCSGAGCDLGHDSAPLTIPVVANFTLIGRGDAATISSGGDVGMVLRRGTGGHYVNGVLGRWARAAISVRDAASQTRITNGDMTIRNILISEAAGPIFQTAQQVGVDTTANNLIRTAATTASLFVAAPAASPTSVAGLDWTPSTGSALATGGLTTFTGQLQTRAGTFATGTAYRGAADPAAATKWWEGWTNYAAN
jgi:hypothetical protein